MERNRSSYSLINVLDTLILRNYAYAFRQLLLAPDFILDKTARIRHYDYQCEAVEHIADILKIPFQRKKMEAFLSIKNHCHRRFIRSNSSSRVKSNFSMGKKLERKNSFENGNLKYSRPLSSCKNKSFTKEDELKQIFSRVKIIAQDLIEEKQDKKVLSSPSYHTPVKISSPIFSKISALEKEMSSLMEVDRILNTTYYSTAPSFRKINNRAPPRNLVVPKSDYYI